LAYFCLNLVVVANPFASLKIQIAYFNSWTPKPYYSQKNFLVFCTEQISAILADFCMNLIAMATLFDHWKITIVYFNLPTPKTLLVMQKNSKYFIQN